jgi:acetyltransferase-like isoleucine patch superfamily enzyme
MLERKMTDRRETSHLWVAPQPKHLQMTQWGWICSHPSGLSIERFADIGCMSYLQAEFGINVGERVLIGSHCSFFSRDDIGGNSGPVVIKEGTSIGTHTTILPNTVIGKSCRIGAYSLIKQGVVLGDGIVLPAYSFVKRSILTPEDLDAFLMKENKRHFNFGGLL